MDANSPQTEQYTHGHHAAVVGSHARRTAANSAAFLVPYLQPGLRILDVGCGPGSITVDLAAIVDPSEVIGIDREPEVLEGARALAAERGLDNITFAPGSAYELAFPDDSFDVVYAHQVLQHLVDPIAALIEMRRVLKPGGLVAVRDSDYGTMVHAPTQPAIDRWLELYHQLTRSNGAEADAGRNLKGWIELAGYTDVIASASSWFYTTPESAQAWAELWAVRVTQSAFADQAIAAGLSNPAELDELAAGWRAWATLPGAYFAFLHGEVLARKASPVVPI